MTIGLRLYALNCMLSQVCQRKVMHTKQTCAIYFYFKIFLNYFRKSKFSYYPEIVLGNIQNHI